MTPFCLSLFFSPLSQRRSSFEQALPSFFCGALLVLGAGLLIQSPQLYPSYPTVMPAYTLAKYVNGMVIHAVCLSYAYTLPPVAISCEHVGGSHIPTTAAHCLSHRCNISCLHQQQSPTFPSRAVMICEIHSLSPPMSRPFDPLMLEVEDKMLLSFVPRIVRVRGNLHPV